MGERGGGTFSENFFFPPVFFGGVAVFTKEF